VLISVKLLKSLKSLNFESCQCLVKNKWERAGEMIKTDSCLPFLGCASRTAGSITALDTVEVEATTS